jgi:formylmethanofuran dehydrogenase subunit A
LLDQPGCKEFTKDYFKKDNRKVARKRKKKQKNMWLNTIQLDSYKGSLFNDENIVIEHRKFSYKLEEDF